MQRKRQYNHRSHRSQAWAQLLLSPCSSASRAKPSFVSLCLSSSSLQKLMLYWQCSTCILWWISRWVRLVTMSCLPCSRASFFLCQLNISSSSLFFSRLSYLFEFSIILYCGAWRCCDMKIARRSVILSSLKQQNWYLRQLSLSGELATLASTVWITFSSHSSTCRETSPPQWRFSPWLRYRTRVALESSMLTQNSFTVLMGQLPCWMAAFEQRVKFSLSLRRMISHSHSLSRMASDFNTRTTLNIFLHFQRSRITYTRKMIKKPIKWHPAILCAETSPRQYGQSPDCLKI